MSEQDPDTPSSSSKSSDTGQTSTASPPKDRLGSACSVKKLYHGGKNRQGYITWLEAPQTEKKDVNTSDESLQHAIVLRYVKGKVPNRHRLQEIIIHNKTIQSFLQSHIPNFSSYYDDAEQGVCFSDPFAPLFFSWDSIELALHEKEEGTNLNGMLHASLLRRILVETFNMVFQKHTELIAAGEITFDLLWTLYRPGCDLVASMGNDEVVAKCGSSRLVKLPLGEEQYTVTWSNLAWDGKDYGWTTSSTFITAFTHRMKISELPIYPLTHCGAKDQLLGQLARRGRVFARLTTPEPHMMMYNGSCNTANDDGQSWWQPHRTIKVTERLMIDTAAYNRYMGRYSSITVHNICLDIPGMILALDSPEQEAKNAEIFVYCTPYVHGFGLQSKRWLKFHVFNISNVIWNTEAWPNLVLASDYKSLIHAFAKAQLESNQEFDDFIRGKGQGMITLLSGPPGKFHQCNQVHLLTK